MHDQLIGQPSYFTTAYFWWTSVACLAVSFVGIFMMDRLWGEKRVLTVELEVEVFAYLDGWADCGLVSAFQAQEQLARRFEFDGDEARLWIVKWFKEQESCVRFR